MSDPVKLCDNNTLIDITFPAEGSDILCDIVDVRWRLKKFKKL